MDANASSTIDLALQGAGAINLDLSLDLARGLVWLPDRSRNMGIHIMAGKGSGKSRLLGRVIAWLDFLRGVPLVIFDPHGPSIDNFLDKLVRLPSQFQERLWPRVVYVDMSGHGGYVVPFPLYYRLSDESLYTIAQRYLDVVHKMDPYLETASVEGWNALWRMGTHTGMILAALGFQVTEASHLLRDPQAWVSRFTVALAAAPEVRPAIEFFTGQYLQWSEDARGRRSDAFANKIALFSLDPTMKAMFGAGRPGIDWARMVHDRRAVLFDFRHEHDLERRRFKMLWVFNYLLDFIRTRGAGRHRPISLIIDELTALLSFESLAVNLLAADLDELINVISRNYMVWLTVAHQELFQLDHRTQKTLMAMGTQVFGATADVQAALTLARQFYRYDPYAVKRYEPIYASFGGLPGVIDYRPIEYTVEEQELLKSYDVTEQNQFQFLVRPAPAEGSVVAPVRPMSIGGFDRDIYVDERLVVEARAMLSRRCGIAVSDALSEIQRRLEKKTANVKRPRLPGGDPAQRPTRLESTPGVESGQARE